MGTRARRTAAVERGLTPRQRDVLDLIIEGRSNAEIGLALGLSVSTVKSHVESVLRHLGAANRTEAANVARGSSRGVPAFEDRPGIAVLRFEVPDDPHAAHLGAGVVDDLIGLLSRWRWFPVIARSTSLHHAASERDAAELGRLLRADYLIAGTIQRSGSRLKIRARLEHAPTQRCLWSDGVVVDARDLFAAQAEVASAIAASAYPEILLAEALGTLHLPTTDLGAWELAHRGLLHLDRRTREDNAEATDLFDRALARDGALMPALFGRGLALFDQVSNQWRADLSSTLAELRACAARALEVDPRHPLAWAVQGRAAIVVGDMPVAEEAFARATALNPSFAYAHAALGQARVVRGDLDGFDNLRLAARLSPRAFASGLAFAHFAARDYESAIRCAREVLASRPTYVFAHAVLCASMGQVDPDGALPDREALLRVHPGFDISGILAMMPKGTTEVSDRMVEGLRRAGLPDQSPPSASTSRGTSERTSRMTRSARRTRRL